MRVWTFWVRLATETQRTAIQVITQEHHMSLGMQYSFHETCDAHCVRRFCRTSGQANLMRDIYNSLGMWFSTYAYEITAKHEDCHTMHLFMTIMFMVCTSVFTHCGPIRLLYHHKEKLMKHIGWILCCCRKLTRCNGVIGEIWICNSFTEWMTNQCGPSWLKKYYVYYYENKVDCSS